LSAGNAAATPLKVDAAAGEFCLHLKLDLPEDYVLYQPELTVPLPAVAPQQGVILDGKLPNWLYTGLTLFYRAAPWVAIYYPPLNQVIVVASQSTAGSLAVGAVIAGAPCRSWGGNGPIKSAINK
jgi:CRISPR-associated Csx3 family protein